MGRSQRVQWQQMRVGTKFYEVRRKNGTRDGRQPWHREIHRYPILEEHAEMLNRIGRMFDPDEFDVEAVNELLQSLHEAVDTQWTGRLWDVGYRLCPPGNWGLQEATLSDGPVCERRSPELQTPVRAAAKSSTRHSAGAWP